MLWWHLPTSAAQRRRRTHVEVPFPLLPGHADVDGAGGPTALRRSAPARAARERDAAFQIARATTARLETTSA